MKVKLETLPGSSWWDHRHAAVSCFPNIGCQAHSLPSSLAPSTSPTLNYQISPDFIQTLHSVLATLAALHFTPVNGAVGRSFDLA